MTNTAQQEQAAIGVATDRAVSGEFVDFDGERYYAIHNVDRMPPFFISLISNDDHWLFASSTGGLTAGRVSPETALFPYITVDNIHHSLHHTGPKTIVKLSTDTAVRLWEPFNTEQNALFDTTRNIYKNTLGNKLCFEEINHDLGVAFRYSWLTSDDYGIVRSAELQNLGGSGVTLELLDGMQNILPAGTPRFTQTNSSNLVDAYKWTELDEGTGLGVFSLYSGITDKAEPCESLKATTVFCLGLSVSTHLLSTIQLQTFLEGGRIQTETHKRGIRGSYFVNASATLGAGESLAWHFVANLEQSQADIVAIRNQLRNPDAILDELKASIDRGSDKLARIMAGSDAFQTTAEENVSAHHYANVLFNVLRGGIFNDQYFVPSKDFRRTVRRFNAPVYTANENFLKSLPDRLRFSELLKVVRDNGDKQLERLAQEYLPITFGRRHGDPSRPWNQFAINLKDEDGNELLSYEGNWRDIFQNWEALTLSYPEFVDNIIAKFVNASTMDGYNPYRITKEGIDWEVEEPDNPWSYIGYWGDHQIIYLLKLLELSSEFEPAKLQSLLREPIFCYANVPYLITTFDKLLEDPKNTVSFDDPLAELIEHRLTTIGADGKLVLTEDEQVYQVNLLEKLLVPLLSKLGNLVVDGGIWMNTQRPEWNDANNALVGNGLSMVTLCYMRRYVQFMTDLLADETEDFAISNEVANWLKDTAAALKLLSDEVSGDEPTSEALRHKVLVELGEASSRFREAVYKDHRFSGQETQSIGSVRDLLADALPIIDKSIRTNRRDDGLYHAYNLLGHTESGISVETLYPMLEGQVGILSSGALNAAQAVEVVEALFESSVFRADQKSFMLYPDRELPSFLEKNRIPEESVQASALLAAMSKAGDGRLVLRDEDGHYRFSADLTNVSDVKTALEELREDYGADVDGDWDSICNLYEEIFNHKAFTGRSGTMFGFEGLGSIYWHMVSKLLLAVMENFFAAIDGGADDGDVKKLAELYYRVREGIGFNKTPAEYGAFPTDPYSHTPKHSGARQPGMTGQVKEEMLSRFGELGVRVSDGAARFEPSLLRSREFVSEARRFGYLDVDNEWRSIQVPAGGLAFSWCQVPVVYLLDDAAPKGLVVTLKDGSEEHADTTTLSREQSRKLFCRSGEIIKITVRISQDMILN
ncbi:MAG: hypothetical protein QNJ05_03600 [Woeseiaceae bacterium]|nr:hypothetical protein [Woeseiaceae bacterium]